MSRSENVKHAFAGRQQVVGDDPPVTAPPHRLRAYERAAARVREFAKMREAIAIFVAQGIVGIVVKTVILPEAIEPGRHFPRAATQPAERGDMLVADLERFERLGQGV